jgi:tRNA threonylcarbamoyladenosine biosynthesis protein TsaE
VGFNLLFRLPVSPSPPLPISPSSSYHSLIMPETLTLDIPDADAMTGLGRRLGALLFPGAVVALVGTLGAGKTFLTRAVAEGLGVGDSRVVSSPTFVLIQEYQGRLPIYHFDAYRLHSEAEFSDLGAAEYFEGHGICLVEWADRVSNCLPPEHLHIAITITGEKSRNVKLTAQGPRFEVLLKELAAGRS